MGLRRARRRRSGDGVPLAPRRIGSAEAAPPSPCDRQTTGDGRPGASGTPPLPLVERLALLTYVSLPGQLAAVTYTSPRLLATLGCALGELATVEGVSALAHPDDRAMILEEHRDALEAGRAVSFEYRLLAQDGSVVWIHDEAEYVPLGEQGGPCLHGRCLDITAHKRVEEELRASVEQFRTVAANVPGVVYRCACDTRWTIRFMSDYIEELTGYPASDFIGNDVRTYGSIIHPEDRQFVVDGVDAALAEGSPYSLHYRLVHADGSPRWIGEYGRAVLDAQGKRLWLDGVILDVTQRTLAELARDRAEAQLKQQAELNRHQALHDSLTGLPNRTLFHDRVRHAILAARREDSELAVLMMDLDRFKEINDTLGHASGDRLLQHVGARLEEALRAGDSIARLGGDEFGLVLPSVSATSVGELVERIRRAVARPCLLDGLQVSIDATIGVALFPSHGDDVTPLLQRADVAMYVAKKDNSGFAMYDFDNDRHEPARLTLVSDLRRAIDERELVLHYQPKLGLRSGRVAGVEALVRWRHPERGLVMPAAFIPVAQETSLIKPLTLYVIDEALRQCRAWAREGFELAVAVNASPRSLIDAEFPDDVARLLGKHGVAPTLLELELTEEAIATDPFRANAVLERLSGMGVRLAMDDFGTGYSSLAYLKRLPLDAIKIDRAFITGLTSSNEDEAIVRSTIDLCRNLGLDVVAEGVETAEVWDCLKRLGCDVAQGYYLSLPLPPAELIEWLRQQSRPGEASAIG